MYHVVTDISKVVGGGLSNNSSLNHIINEYEKYNTNTSNGYSNNRYSNQYRNVVNGYNESISSKVSSDIDNISNYGIFEGDRRTNKLYNNTSNLFASQSIYGGNNSHSNVYGNRILPLSDVSQDYVVNGGDNIYGSYVDYITNKSSLRNNGYYINDIRKVSPSSFAYYSTSNNANDMMYNFGYSSYNNNVSSQDVDYNGWETSYISPIENFANDTYVKGMIMPNVSVMSQPIVGSKQYIRETYDSSSSSHSSGDMNGKVDLNVSGTIKLTTDKGGSAEIDLMKLLNNQQFINQLATIISNEFSKRSNFGISKDNNAVSTIMGGGYSRTFMNATTNGNK